jgi:hypothetical protein
MRDQAIKAVHHRARVGIAEQLTVDIATISTMPMISQSRGVIRDGSIKDNSPPLFQSR